MPTGSPSARSSRLPTERGSVAACAQLCGCARTPEFRAPTDCYRDGAISDPRPDILRIPVRLPALLTAAAVLAVPIALAVPMSASAATAVGTFADLQSAISGGDSDISLSADITTTGNTLDVSGHTVTIDLNGHTLSVTSPTTGAAILVPALASLTIADSAGGGHLTASGSLNGAAIGGSSGSAGTIVITGGSISATAGSGAAAIGGGFFGAGGSTTISGGTVDAHGTNGAGIGGGADGGGGTVTISGGSVTTHGAYGAGIGGGYNAAGGSVTISGGAVTASSQLGAGIGGGDGIGGAAPNGGSVTVTGGTVSATGGDNSAGIGGGAGGDGGVVTITGGTTTATGGASGAGIGAGSGGGAGSADVQGTPTGGSSAGGGGGLSAPAPTFTQSVTPAGVTYTATSTDSEGGSTVIVFHYLVTFDPADGAAVTTETVDAGSTASAPSPPPTRDAYQFLSWQNGATAFDFSTPITAPLDLTATWRAALAATGVDPAGPIALAVLLLLVGAAVMVTSRALVARSAPRALALRDPRNGSAPRQRLQRRVVGIRLRGVLAGHELRREQERRHDLGAVVVRGRVVDSTALALLQFADHLDRLGDQLAGVLVDGQVLDAGDDRLDRLDLGVLAGDDRDALPAATDCRIERARLSFGERTPSMSLSRSCRRGGCPCGPASWRRASPGSDLLEPV